MGTENDCYCVVDDWCLSHLFTLELICWKLRSVLAHTIGFELDVELPHHIGELHLGTIVGSSIIVACAGLSCQPLSAKLTGATFLLSLTLSKGCRDKYDECHLRKHFHLPKES